MLSYSVPYAIKKLVMESSDVKGYGLWGAVIGLLKDIYAIFHSLYASLFYSTPPRFRERANASNEPSLVVLYVPGLFGYAGQFAYINGRFDKETVSYYIKFDHGRPLCDDLDVLKKCYARLSAIHSVVLIGHSRGGLLIHRLCQDPDLTKLPAAVVTISSPFNGANILSEYSRLYKWIEQSFYSKICLFLDRLLNSLQLQHARYDVASVGGSISRIKKNIRWFNVMTEVDVIVGKAGEQSLSPCLSAEFKQETYQHSHLSVLASKKVANEVKQWLFTGLNNT